MFLLGCSSDAGEQEQFFIRDGDRVVFWGDSITAAQPWPRTIENYVLTTHPDWNVSFRNLSWSGDTADNLARMKRDFVLAGDPTLTVIVLGMNDGGYGPWSEEIQQTYERGMRELISYALAQGSRVLVLTPIRFEADRFPINPYTQGDMTKYPEALRKLSDGASRVAKELGADVIDINKYYAEVESEWKKIDPDLKLSFDGIHPHAEGFALLAYALLREGGGSFHISEEVIDWKAKSAARDGEEFVVEASNTNGKAALKWKREKPRLPFVYGYWDRLSFPKEIREQIAPKDLLRVKNLASEFGLVTADGRPIGVWSRGELEEGVNLAVLPEWGPGGMQSQFLLELIKKRHELFFEYWRDHLLPYSLNPKDLQPLAEATADVRLLMDQVEFYQEAAWKNDDPEPIMMELIGVNGPDALGEAPFELVHPLPALDEVQVLFTFDTNGLRNLFVDEGFPAESFTPPLKIRGNFVVGKTSRVRPGFATVELNDEGKAGDSAANDGVWSLVTNLKKSAQPVTFFFNDRARNPAQIESPIFERVRQWRSQLIPDRHQHVQFGEAEIQGLIEKGLLRRN